MRSCVRIGGRGADGGGTLLALLAALLVLALAPPSPARAATGPEYYGTNLQSLGVAPVSRWPLFFDQLAVGQLGVNRFEVRWDLIEANAPDRGVHRYDWSGLDALVGPLAARGLRLAPLFRYSPAWAQTARDELPPSSYPNFAMFLAAAAQRYGPGGSFWAANPAIPPRPFLTYEVWNEPNLDQYAWNHRADPVAYAGLLRVVRPILKGVQPSAILLGTLAWQTDGPGVAPNYVARLAAAGGLDQIDGMGYHPYAPDAQSTIDLVTGLRAQLAAAGHGALPIYANESGQPVVLSGPGAQYAFAGRPTDAARASSVAFAGDALAASDCSVEQFLLYSISGTEREFEEGGEPIGEGFMGMLSKDTALPNVTGQALQRASLRWAARFRPGGAGLPGPPLPLCGSSAAGAPANALPIGITVTGAGPGCARIRTTYDGNQLESAMLRLTDVGGGTLLAESRTDARGETQGCIPLTLRGGAFEVSADIPRAGASSTVVCDVPGVGCPPDLAIAPAESRVSASTLIGHPGPQVTQAAPRPSGPCTWKLYAAQRTFKAGRSVSRSRATMRAVVSCETAPVDAKLRFTLLTKDRRTNRERRIRVLTLQNKVPRTLTVKGKLRRGDKLVLLRPADRAAKIPRLRSVTVFGVRPGAGSKK